MDTEATTAKPRIHSLRNRYLRLASAAALLLIAAAIVSSWYAGHATRSNTAALKLRDDVTSTVGRIRSEIWSADFNLNAMLISPRPEHELRIITKLEAAQSQLRTLADRPAISHTPLVDQIQTLQSQLGTLSNKVRQLIELRHDTNWVYPILPYISTKLLEPNIEFETAVDQALREIAESDGRPYASALYGRFDEVRDLWRRKILNFRAVIIRFAGLRDIETTSQETNIGNLNDIIEIRLAELVQLKAQGKLGFETETALETMRLASKRWQENWLTVKQLRSSSIWRADIQFLETHIRPVQKKIFDVLTDIETTITQWSAQNLSTVQRVATQISYVLWGLSGLAIIFVISVYFMIDHSVLAPIARIADSISTEGKETQYRLEDQSSYEINKLVQAFNAMRQQIHQRQLALEHQALHDALTGLPNRVLLKDRLDQAMNIMRRNQQPMALLLLDLDRFKEINDTLGHHVGDLLLQQVGKRLERILRESDTIARLGGDEFAIVAPNTSAEQARLFAEKISAAINDVFSVEQQNLYVGVSIGIAVFPQHGNSGETLIRHADIAMYVAKHKGLDYALYQETQDQHSIDRLALVGDLHDELAHAKNLELYYQPQINLLSREIVAVEALLRWNHPQMGPVPPERIINMAEHTGLIRPLTEWVVNTALRDCQSCLVHGGDLSVAVNLSAWNMQDPELPDMIRSALATHKHKTKNLTLEITESAMMNDPVRAREVLGKLNNMGVILSIDDFGTGFSSLGYLKLLPVNDLKIDRSFVLDMLEDENDAIIVHSTIELAHNLGLRVVAEGVEDNETLLRLRRLKCDIAQGYHISMPLPKNEFERWFFDYRPQAVL